MPDDKVTLCGQGLSIGALYEIAQGKTVRSDPTALKRMANSNVLILDAVSNAKPVYGVTTGLGPRVVQALTPDKIDEMVLNTVRGRAHSLGRPLSREIVRGAMAVRLNSLLIGASGASPNIGSHIEACLNADLVPVVGETASTGAADLLWGGTMGLALVGEGAFLGEPDGTLSSEAIKRAGIPKLALGPRDGLALASHSCFSAAIAAIGNHQSGVLWKSAQTAAAMTLEGFRGNLSPLNPDLLQTRPQPGQVEAACDLLERLKGSTLHEPGAARRLQDPLSIRNTAQVHGSVFAALKTLEETVTGEINGASDNPIVLPETGEIMSGGGYLNPHLGVTLVATNHALVHISAQIAARTVKMLNSRFTELPSGLVSEEANSAGLAPVTKACEALCAEIAHLASPPPVYPSFSADGVEDTITNAAIPAKALIEINHRLSRLIAIELIVAAQAIELRDLGKGIAPALLPVLKTVRQVSPRVTSDRSMTRDIEMLAGILSNNALQA